MAEKRRTAILHDALGARTISVNEEHISILKACMWSHRPFQIIYSTGDQEMFHALLRMQLKNEGGIPGKWVVQHILQASQATIEEA